MVYFVPNYCDIPGVKNQVLQKAGMSWKGDVLVMKMYWDCSVGEHVVEQFEEDDVGWVMECLTRYESWQKMAINIHFQFRAIEKRWLH